MRKYTLASLLSMLVVLPLILNNCTESNLKSDNPMFAGKQALIVNCGACHNLPNQSSTGIAPSFLEIKEAYSFQSEQKFSTSIIEFLNNPSVESSKMKTAVEKYGVMPKMSYSEKELNKITHYLYNSDLKNYKKILQN